MPAVIFLIDGSFNIEDLRTYDASRFSAVFCLFWMTSTTKKRIVSAGFENCFSLNDIISNYKQLEDRATILTSKICSEGPQHAGLFLRSYLSEFIYRECLKFEISRAAVNFIRNFQHTNHLSKIKAEYTLSSFYGDTIQWIINATDAHKEIHWAENKDFKTADENQYARQPWRQRMKRHLNELIFTKNWKSFLWAIIEKIDPCYSLRCQFFGFPLPVDSRKEKITFFSSYLNNSKNLIGLEPFMPLPVSWVFTNYFARQGANSSRQPKHWLFQYGNNAFKPTTVRDRLSIATFSKNADETLFRGWISTQSIWQQWNTSLLPGLLFLTNCWENYLEHFRPRMIVMGAVGHWGIEGWLAQIAKKRRVPIIQTMHGVVSGQFYTNISITADFLLVYGDFWKKLYPKNQQNKIIVFNPPGNIKKVPPKKSSGKPSITFFSWPVAQIATYSYYEILNGFVHLIHRLAEKNECTITVRFHPKENSSDFINRYISLYGSLPESIEFDKNSPLDDIISKTDIALMFRSTVMLNCIYNGIPVILPGWLADFEWRESLRDISGIHLADDFDDIEKHAVDWMQNPDHLDLNCNSQFIESFNFNKDKFIKTIELLLSD